MKYIFAMQNLKNEDGVMLIPLARLPRNVNELVRWVQEGFQDHYGISSPVLQVLPAELANMPMGEELRRVLAEGMRQGNSLGIRRPSRDGTMMFSIQELMKPFGESAEAN